MSDRALVIDGPIVVREPTEYGFGAVIKKRKHLKRLKDGSVVVNAHGRASIITGGFQILDYGRPVVLAGEEFDAAPPYRVIHVP